MIHDISITEEALKEVAKDLCCTLSNLKRLLGIIEHTFKPFDKVLVRDEPDGFWKAKFFERYSKDVPFGYFMIDGTVWRYCIPYEGNEDKLNNN